MALIAGCQIKNHKISSVEIENRLRNFSIFADDDLTNYNNLVIATPFGYLLRKYRNNYPIYPGLYNDRDGNALLTLGFFSSPVTSVSAQQLERHEGEFVVVLAEQSGRLHIVNDRFGSRPFYILDNGDGVFFSSNLAFLLELVGGKHEADVLGWFHVFSYGHTFGDQTTFKNVKRLPPATHTTVSPNGLLEQRSYWRLEYNPASDLNSASYSKEVFEAFGEGAALRSRLVGKGVVALSGGLDSRLVAAALPNDVEFSAFTFVNSARGNSSADTEVAAQVAQILGLQHRIDAIPTQEYSTIAEDVIRLTGGMRPLHHSATVMPYVREMQRCGVNFLLGGGPGDVSAGSKIPSVKYLDASQKNECIREFCRDLACGAEYLRFLFRDEIIKEYQSDIYPSLLESFGDIAGHTAAHKVTAWEMLNRWPAFTFTSVMHNHPEVSEAFCHLDYKYTDLMLRLPAEWLYQRNFYGLMIYNSLPKLRHIPYANTGRPLCGQLQHFAFNLGVKSRTVSFVGQLARRVVPQKIKRLLKPIPKGTPGFHYYLYKNDQRLFADIRECLHSSTDLKRILDTDKCLRFLNDFKDDALDALPYDSQTELIGSLATMCFSFKGMNGRHLPLLKGF